MGFGIINFLISVRAEQLYYCGVLHFSCLGMKWDLAKRCSA